MSAGRTLDDDTLLAGFESCDLGEHPFGHREHVRVAWLMLRREPLLAALRRFVDAIKRFAASKGVPGKYHETITVAFILLIHERMAGGPSTSDAFVDANPDLLDLRDGPLARHYGADLLDSEEGRRRFLLPAA